jgi:hypothetical protein
MGFKLTSSILLIALIGLTFALLTSVLRCTFAGKYFEESSNDKKCQEEAVDDKKEKSYIFAKTIWDSEFMNGAKPLWRRKANEVTEKEYVDFYKVLNKDTQEPLAHTHFETEGEVTFKSILFVPKPGPNMGGFCQYYPENQATINVILRFFSFIFQKLLRFIFNFSYTSDRTSSLLTRTIFYQNF